MMVNCSATRYSYAIHNTKVIRQYPLYCINYIKDSAKLLFDHFSDTKAENRKLY
jgi:hypothetical protein